MQAAIGISTAQDYIKAAKEAVEKARQDLNGEEIKFAFVFSAGESCHSLVLETIADLIGPVPLLGTSSTAIISRQGSLKQGLMVILFALAENTYFNTACVKDIGAKATLSAGEELGERLLYGCKNVRRNLSVIFSNTEALYSSSFITGLQERLGMSFPLVGASITDHKESCLYFGSEILRNAACGILWGGKFNFNLGIEHGWEPLGKPRYVTRSQGDIVNEIDGAPAVNLYKEYFAKEIPWLKKELRRLSAFYPLGMRISEKKEYLLRSIVAIQDDGSLVFRGEVPQGSSVRLMISSKEACLLSASNAAKTALKNMGGKKIKLALILDSLSRNILLGRQAAQEIKLIQDILGTDVPLAGIYTSAEQAPLNAINYLGRVYFHNNSIAVLTLAD
ncbi:MAG: FIST N-terminal domain-containing protein [Candidatus Omnitrophica bacterium]|nr:FIST N-terminal domain-containing protein [Candidatus Omnitrophota bacterium]